MKFKDFIGGGHGPGLAEDDKLGLATHKTQ